MRPIQYPCQAESAWGDRSGCLNSNPLVVCIQGSSVPRVRSDTTCLVTDFSPAQYLKVSWSLNIAWRSLKLINLTVIYVYSWNLSLSVLVYTSAIHMRRDPSECASIRTAKGIAMDPPLSNVIVLPRCSLGFPWLVDVDLYTFARGLILDIKAHFYWNKDLTKGENIAWFHIRKRKKGR